MLRGTAFLIAIALPVVAAFAQPKLVAPPVETWRTATGQAAGVSISAKEEAKQAALRKCVEEACGVFLTSQSRTEDYKTVYDKVLANTAGYVIRFDVVKEWTQGDISCATVKALVSTRRFEESWANIAHTVLQEGNPRVLIAIAEATYMPTTSWVNDVKEVKEAGAVQSKIEEFFIDKGITLVDKATAADVTKRDILLASLKDDTAEVAALGARFKADVVIVGQASAKYGDEISVGGTRMYPYSVTLNIRAIQCDSARLLVSKPFGPYSVNSMSRRGGEDKALAKIGDQAAPEILKAVVEAWRKRATASRGITLSISNMDYRSEKTFEKELHAVDGVLAINLREITESVANIDVDYKFTTKALADRLMEFKEVKLEVIEFNANRIKLKVIK